MALKVNVQNDMSALFDKFAVDPDHRKEAIDSLDTVDKKSAQKKATKKADKKD